MPQSNNDFAFDIEIRWIVLHKNIKAMVWICCHTLLWMAKHGQKRKFTLTEQIFRYLVSYFIKNASKPQGFCF